MCPPSCWIIWLSFGILLGVGMAHLSLWMLAPPVCVTLPRAASLPFHVPGPQYHITVYAANTAILGTLLVAPSPYHANAVQLRWVPDAPLEGYVRVTDLTAALEVAWPLEAHSDVPGLAPQTSESRA